MGLITHVFNDLDGCFGDFDKPKYPNRQDFSGHIESLDRLRGLFDRVKAQGVGLSAVTGRSLHMAEAIVQRTGLDRLSVFEMGGQLYHPITGVVEDTAPLLKPEQVGLYNRFFRWIAQEGPEVTGALQSAFPRGNVIPMHNTRMYTVEFEPCDDQRRYVAAAMAELPDEFKEAIEQGYLMFSPCAIAFDLRPTIGKKEATGYVRERLGLDREKCLGIGDSLHSDKPMMTECGSVACVANANEGLQNYVRSRGGFVAEAPYAAGVEQIYKHFFDV
jgi:hydroxymethylpyrimidine pyrophosphatase-like HAD family hydrolase